MSERSGKGLTLSVGQIVVEDRGRKDFRGLDKLMASIARHGLIHPIVVSPKEGTEKFVLVAGERRLRAMLLLAWTEIPCTLRDDLSRLEQKEIELEENLQRKSLEWSEEIRLLKQIDEVKREIHGHALKGTKGGGGWGMRQTAEAVGKPLGQVSEQIKFAKLLEKRPELEAEVKQMPLSVAMRVVGQKLEAERVERLMDSGGLKKDSRLLEGDALSLIKNLDDNSVDLVLTDPPFGIGTLEDLRGESKGQTQSYTQVMKEADNSTARQMIELFEALMPEIQRVLKPSGHFYIFFAFELYGDLMRILKAQGFSVGWAPIIWHKGSQTAMFMGYEYAPCYEPILFGHKPPRKKRLEKSEKLVIEFKTDSAKDKQHPFQKPLALLKFLIRQSTSLGDLVLDPFAGSGSTLVAAKELGRQSLGFELDHEHFLKAQKRLLEGAEK